MRRPRLILLAFALLVVTQAPGVDAAERGVIKGVVLNAARDKPQEGVVITLVGAREDGSDVVRRRATTGPDGTYRFRNLPTGDDRLYVLDARHDGGLFSGRAVSLPAAGARRPVIDTTLRVWDTTTDPNSILVERSNLFLSPGDGALDVIESVNVINQTERAYIGRGTGEDAAAPSLGLALPSAARDGGVQIVDSTIEIPGLVETDFGAGITAAIPPGTTRITFRYRVTGTAGNYDLSRTAVYPIVSFSVHAPSGVEVRSNRLDSSGDVDVGGISYQRWSSTAATDAGNAVQVVAVLEAGTAPGLVAGLVAAALLAAGLILFGVLRRGDPAPARAGDSVPAEPETRAGLLTAIARLDIDRDAGALSDEEWSKRRALLKGRLERTTPEKTS